MIRMAWKELVGLFVDDEFLAIAILLAIALAGGLSLVPAVPGWIVGAVLAVSMPGVLVAGVIRTVVRKRG